MRRAIVIAALLAASPAHADKADRLFEKAKKLHGDRKYAEACPTFEEVDKLDPGIGAKLNTAKCYEDWGRLATAYRWYNLALDDAKSSKDERAPKIKELIEELDINVPRVTIKVPEGANPDVLATLSMDGKKLDPSLLNTEQLVDPGPHVIEWVVDGQKKKKLAPVEKGGESEVSLDIPAGAGTGTLPDKGPDPTGPTGPGTPETPDPGKTRRYLGIGLTAAGGVGIGVAVAITLSARGTYRDALEAHCMGTPTMCNDEGLRITRDARSTANIATVVTIASALAIGGGVVLYLTAPKAEKPSNEGKTVYVSPVVDATGGGFVLGGTF